MGAKVTIINKDEIHEIFDIQEKLGSGNFAVVKKAVRRTNGQVVALKIVKKSTLKPKELETIHDEVEIMQRIDHPNCVRLFDIYESSEKLYMAMEFLQGGELFERIVQKEKFSEHEAAEAIKQICEGLKNLHSVGVVHRDLKPENLLYETKEDNSRLKITDFGLAKYRTENLDLMTSCCGTPGYVAPEVLKHQAYDEKCDLWSLGVILYILLCGFPPFHSDNTAELYRQIKRGDYSFPDPYWTNVSDLAKDLVTKLLKVDPKERLNAEEVLAHQWVKRETDQPKDFHASFNLNLKQLLARRKLRRGVQIVLALNKLRSMLHYAHDAAEAKHKGVSGANGKRASVNIPQTNFDDTSSGSASSSARNNNNNSHQSSNSNGSNGKTPTSPVRQRSYLLSRSGSRAQIAVSPPAPRQGNNAVAPRTDTNRSKSRTSLDDDNAENGGNNGNGKPAAIHRTRSKSAAAPRPASATAAKKPTKA